jgi:hypothetical protein
VGRKRLMARQYKLDKVDADLWREVVRWGLTRVDEKGTFFLEEEHHLTALQSNGRLREVWERWRQCPIEERKLVFPAGTPVWVPNVQKGPYQVLYVIGGLVWTMILPEDDDFYVEDIRGIL